MSGKPNARASNLAELCSPWDSAFIEKAYWTLLGRAPDPDGGTHYLNQIRSGVSKMTILLRLRESKEGRARDPKIEGLDEALRKHRQAIQPFTGRLVRFFTRRAGDSGHERTQRAIVNHLAAISPESGNAGGHEAPGSGPAAGVGIRTEIGMVDHLLMRLVRVEASLKRIEERMKRSPVPTNGGKVARKA